LARLNALSTQFCFLKSHDHYDEFLVGRTGKSFFFCSLQQLKWIGFDPKHFHNDLEWITSIHNPFHINVHIFAHCPAASLTTGSNLHIFCCRVQTLHLQCTYSYMVPPLSLVYQLLFCVHEYTCTCTSLTTGISRLNGPILCWMLEE